MTAIPANSANKILERVIRDPEFKALSIIPLIPVTTFTTVLFAYSLFIASSYLYFAGYLPIAALILFNAFAIYAAFTPLHDATHRSVSCNQNINDLIGTVSAFLLIPGMTSTIYRYLHLEHHRFTGDLLRDPDEPFVSSRGLKLLGVLMAPDLLWTKWYVEHWASRPAIERFKFCVSIGIYLLVHVVFLSSNYALEFMLCWMLPQRLGLLTVTYLFAHIQHPEGITWERQPFQTTARINSGRYLRFFMLGQTEHCVHHFLPSLPFYRYYAAWRVGQRIFEQQNIPVRDVFSNTHTSINQQTPQMPIEAIILSTQNVSHNIRQFVFGPVNGETQLPSFDAGAHIDVMLNEGITRQYSICSDPADTSRFSIMVKRDMGGRGGSIAMHQTLNSGDNISISAPRNNFPLDHQFDHYLLLGAGIGITPLLSMAHVLHRLNKRFEFHIYASTADDLPSFLTDGSLPFTTQITLHLDEDSRFNNTDLLLRDTQGAAIYTCGPLGFMDKVKTQARGLGWKSQQIFSESFVAEVLEHEPNQAFEVQLGQSGKILSVGADEYLLDVLNDAKVGIPYSCTQGICGSCITQVISGDIEHRDAILSDADRADGNKLCVCVSRAKGRLILDI